MKPMIVIALVGAGVAVTVWAAANRGRLAPESAATPERHSQKLFGPVPGPAAPEQTPSGQPQAQVDAREFNFGTVEPLRAHRHTFEFRNTGTAPLSLSSRGSSCKCLKVEIVDQTVAPGQLGRVDVVWEARPSQDLFLQRATVATNDPARPTIELTVEGQSRIKRPNWRRRSSRRRGIAFH
jgi:hypothetical protein